MKSKFSKSCVPALVLMLTLLPAARADTLRPVEPEAEGFSEQRLERLTSHFQAMVDEGELAGISLLIARHGNVVLRERYGDRDLASNKPIEDDTIFRIFSMTKPVTGAALLMLYEEGKWRPEDPLSKHIPEFADLKVYAGTDDDGELILEDPVHAVTVGDVMSHTGGFTYGFFGQTPVDEMYRDAGFFELDSAQAFIEKLSGIPLAYQPGTEWQYSVSVDIQGYLVEKLSGQTLAEFMKQHIFDPLGMPDTGFAVPREKMNRLATLYRYDPDEGLLPVPHDGGVNRIPGFASGGGGLYSTLDDYARFAQMLANGGELDGVRLLAPATVRLMRTNHLPEELTKGGFGIGWQQMRPGFGFGYDVAVYYDPSEVGSITGEGTYLWDGAAGTWFWNDPENDIVFVGMIQRFLDGNMPHYQELSRNLVLQSLVDP